ncbi:MAG: prepilin-type N-terminal cleavage/methylation domain-containing protein [Thermodesulfobacteriota bacterium]
MRRRANGSLFPKSTSPGFTLMEVTITLTILGFIVLIAFGAFRMGASAWEKGDSVKDEYEKVRIASQLISHQFKSIVPYRVKTQKAEGDYVAFEGRSQTVRFVSAVSTKARQPEGFTYAIYEFKSEGRDEGSLILYEQRALNKDLFEEHPKEEEGVSLCEGISRVKFEYYREENVEKNQQGGWVDEWNAKDEKELPRAIRMTMTYMNEKKEEVPITLFVSIPAWKPETLSLPQAGRGAGAVQQRFQRPSY